MASVSIRSGGIMRRRLLSLFSEVGAEHATAAVCHRQIRPIGTFSGSTTSSRHPCSMLYEPRVTTTPVCKVLARISSSLAYEAMMESAHPVILRCDATSTIWVSSPAPQQPRVENAPPVILRCDATGTISVSSAPHQQLIVAAARSTVSRPSSRAFDLQTHAGAGWAATSFRRNMSSASSPCAGAAGNELCKFDEKAVVSRLDTIDEKVDKVEAKVEKVDTSVGNVETKVDILDGKVDAVLAKLQKNVDDCTSLANDVAALKKKEEGSGDWTSFRIKGKNLNWLSVGSAICELWKSYFK